MRRALAEHGPTALSEAELHLKAGNWNPVSPAWRAEAARPPAAPPRSPGFPQLLGRGRLSAAGACAASPPAHLPRPPPPARERPQHQAPHRARGRSRPGLRAREFSPTSRARGGGACGPGARGGAPPHRPEPGVGGGGFSRRVGEPPPLPPPVRVRGPAAPRDLSGAAAPQEAALPPSTLQGAGSSLGAEERRRPQPCGGSRWASWLLRPQRGRGDAQAEGAWTVTLRLAFIRKTGPQPALRSQRVTRGS